MVTKSGKKSPTEKFLKKLEEGTRRIEQLSLDDEDGAEKRAMRRHQREDDEEYE